MIVELTTNILRTYCGGGPYSAGQPGITCAPPGLFLPRALHTGNSQLLELQKTPNPSRVRMTGVEGAEALRNILRMEREVLVQFFES